MAENRSEAAPVGGVPSMARHIESLPCVTEASTAGMAGRPQPLHEESRDRGCVKPPRG